MSSYGRATPHLLRARLGVCMTSWAIARPVLVAEHILRAAHLGRRDSTHGLPTLHPVVRHTTRFKKSDNGHVLPDRTRSLRSDLSHEDSCRYLPEYRRQTPRDKGHLGRIFPCSTFSDVSFEVGMRSTQHARVAHTDHDRPFAC